VDVDDALRRLELEVRQLEPGEMVGRAVVHGYRQAGRQAVHVS